MTQQADPPGKPAAAPPAQKQQPQPQPQPQQRTDVAKGAAAWGVEFTSAVLMILANKFLMTRGAAPFRFPVTLTAAHFATTAAGTAAINSCCSGGRAPGDRPALPPWWAVGGFVLLSSLAIILSNGSLLLNSVAFYQIMKLPTLPFVALLEWSTGGKVYTWTHVALYGAVLAGVSLTIVGDVLATRAGAAVACLSFMSAGSHQFFCGRLQRAYGMSPSQLLALVSPYKAALLFSMGPFVDHAWFGSWIGDYDWTPRVACMAALTCVLAISLNLSQYAVISLLGVSTYGAFSQLKTAAVVVLGSLVFVGSVDPKQLLGTAVAILGVLALAQHERRLQQQQQGGLPAAAAELQAPGGAGQRGGYAQVAADEKAADTQAGLDTDAPGDNRV